MDLTCEERPSDSPLVALVWRGRTETDSAFTSMAETHCSVVVSRYRGAVSLTVRGPETRPSPASGLADAETFGILFRPGVFLADWLPGRVMNRSDVTLPGASSGAFWLKGAAWQFPDFDNAETFVSRLVRGQHLTYEPIVERVLSGQPLRDLSPRTVQRRFLHATGMTRGMMLQIERARLAAGLLVRGTSILETMHQAGYYDQPHLTRALKAFIGLTPAQLLSPARTRPLSFLYKTLPLYSGDTEGVADEGEQRWEIQRKRE
jgi:AraC-like DNA-binding protein